MTDLVVSANEAARLLCVSGRTIERHCESGRLRSHKTTGNGGDQYRIALVDLPESAQVRYWIGQLKALLTGD